MPALLLLAAIVYISYRVAPREKQEHAHVHGAGQIGLAAALALFGVDYFTSYFYATGEMMHALHPYGLQDYAYYAALVIGLANFAFGGLYIYSLGIFNEGGGSYAASMRYLVPTLSLIVAVTLIQDYILTVVVSTLSGSDQLLSILGLYGQNPWYHIGIAASLAAITWFLTIRGRGESAQTVFTMLGVFVLMTVVLAIGLFVAHAQGVPAVPAESAHVADVPIWEALAHLLTASMKGMVALTGLEAISNGIQFVVHEDAEIVQWGRKRFPQWEGLWHFFSGKVGIGRLVQTSFLFYGGLTTLFLTFFAIRFNVYDGTLERTLVGNLALIGFSQIPGSTLQIPWGGLGEINVLFWFYQFLAVALLSAASITAFQDIQASEWRNVAMGEIPEAVIYRDQRGTFRRSVNMTFVISVVLMVLVQGKTTVAVPFYGVGVFMPISVMGLAVREHVKRTYTGRKRTLGLIGVTSATVLALVVFVGQIVGKWHEGGWVALVSFSIMAIIAHLILISPFGQRDPTQIHRIVREKARMHGATASIVEWQSLRMQEYRYSVLGLFVRLLKVFGVYQPVRLEQVPTPAGAYREDQHVDEPDAPSPLEPFLHTDRPVTGVEPPTPLAPVSPTATKPQAELSDHPIDPTGPTAHSQ